MRQILLAIAFLVSSAVFADAASPPDVFTVSADQWAQPRNGAALLKLQPIQDVVHAWLAQPDAHIVIRHPPSDAGALWAGEVQDWLVSLGIPADHIEKRASADQPDDAVSLLVQRA